MAIGVMQGMGWTWDEYLDAPDDLIQELEIRFAKQAAVSHIKPKKG